MPQNTFPGLPTSIFASHAANVYTRYDASIVVSQLVGGIPSNPKVAEGWIKKNLGADNADLIAEMVAKTMIERGVDQEAAIAEAVEKMNLNGFKRDEHGLYIEGRQLKAALKESSNICWPKRAWGPSRKGTRSFWAEHVFVQEDKIYLGVTEPTGVQQRFVATWRGSSIQYEEFVNDVTLNFTVICDVPDEITDADWADVWVRGENQGVGAARALGYGKYAVIKFEQAGAAPAAKKRGRPAKAVTVPAATRARGADKESVPA